MEEPKTYRTLTRNGDVVPFLPAEYVTKYGYSIYDWHHGFFDKFADTPTNCADLTEMGQKFDRFFKFHETELTSLFESLQLPEFANTTDITETETHSGTDSGHVGGTDTGTTGGTGNDYRNSYDNATLRQTGKTETTGTTSYTRDTTQTTTHGHVITKTRVGHTESPWKYFNDYRNAATFSFFDYVLEKLVDVVSIKIY